MSARREPVSAMTTFHSEGPDHRHRARVPAEIRDRLGARPGDKLVFQEGTDAAVDAARTKAALLRKPFFVVYLEQPVAASKGEETGPVDASPAAEQQQLQSDGRGTHNVSQLDPLEEVVMRRLQVSG